MVSVALGVAAELVVLHTLDTTPPGLGPRGLPELPLPSVGTWDPPTWPWSSQDSPALGLGPGSLSFVPTSHIKRLKSAVGSWGWSHLL